MQHIDSSPHHAFEPIARARRTRLAAFLATTDSALPSLLRLSLGGVILAHGLQKVFGWFDGYGVTATMKFFASVGIPAPLGALVIVSDFFGSLALLLGFATRLSAFGAFAVMLGALLIVHLPNGFFMNWGGASHGEGYEFHLLALAMAASLVISGGGRASVDAWLGRKLARRG